MKRMPVDKILALNVISPQLSREETAEIKQYIQVGYAMRALVEEGIRIAFGCSKCKKTWGIKEGLEHECEP